MAYRLLRFIFARRLDHIVDLFARGVHRFELIGRHVLLPMVVVKTPSGGPLVESESPK